jgi:hypothetical protein
MANNTGLHAGRRENHMNIPQVKLTKGAAIAGGAVLIVAGAYIVARGPAGAAKEVAGAVVGLVDGLIAGTVIGIGKMIGIPETEQSACMRAKAAGDKLAASAACPAGEFLGWLFSSKQNPPAGGGGTFGGNGASGNW